MDITNRQLLYKIVCARDKRYDGRFYCGVRTTGIYCRPICPARPQLKNLTFYRSSTEAEQAGFRPCLRCRPDLAPNSAQWGGTAATVTRALAMIARGEADDVSIEHLAQRLGVSDRHLRRLFAEHVGASPIEVAASKRLHLAKQLITLSTLPMTDIAFASGYQSIRRFNEVFKNTFRVAPSILRRSKKGLSGKRRAAIHIEIPVIAPFDADHIFGFLKNHGVAGVESIKDHTYKRAFAIKDAVGDIEVTYQERKSQLLAAITVSDAACLRECIERVRDLFDTRLNPHAHLNDLSPNDPVATHYLDALGIRVPGAWDAFETAICIILGQLVSVEQAKLKVKKLVMQFGHKISAPSDPNCSYQFPTAIVLAVASLKEIGITKIREQAVQALSQKIVTGEIDLSRSTDIEKTKAQLLSIKGIGPWTMEMIAMRCLGDSNAFPKTDLIIKRALAQHELQKGDWSPWNSYITLALWKTFATTLSKKGRPSVTTKS